MRLMGRWFVLVLLAGVLLQLFFVGRIALMVVVDPVWALLVWLRT